jgi:UDP-N-acetylglucosamine--dolichyl-phosphate N-acetylglucosaminephosphotransferase
MDPYLPAAVLGASFAGFYITHKMIPVAKEALFEKGIYGIDINKTTVEQRAQFREVKKSGNWTPEWRRLVVPESLGILVGAVYLCTVIAIIVMMTLSPVKNALALQQMNAAISGIALMLLLGFVDDVMDVRWRHKIILSAFGTIPLLLSYDGSTDIVVPIQLRPYVGTAVLPLGVLYLVYMMLYCIFCTNSINILAGVNGVEVGQSLVIGVAHTLHTCYQLYYNPDASPEDIAGHKIAFVLLVPFITCSWALWLFNKYPSQVFVGDSYTYFAGMVLAVAGIAGHSTKTLALFFLPQIINFVLSIPQLLKIVECPRHRVPKWNKATNKLENSRNYTILNAILVFTGPLHEAALTRALILFAVFCCGLAFIVRYYFASFFFEVVR